MRLVLNTVTINIDDDPGTRASKWKMKWKVHGIKNKKVSKEGLSVKQYRFVLTVEQQAKRDALDTKDLHFTTTHL